MTCGPLFSSVILQGCSMIGALPNWLQWRNDYGGGMNVPRCQTAFHLFISVALELTREGAGFIAKSKEGHLDVIVLEKLEAKRPIVACGAIDEDEGKFEASD